MIVLAGGHLVLPDRIHAGVLIIDGDRIGSIESSRRVDSEHAAIVDVADCYVVPGFVDVHVHGVDGYDTLDTPAGGESVIDAIAARLPKYGVTAFCPTTVACDPHELRRTLDLVGRARADVPPGRARVLPAHLESNFINPEYRGAQPPVCLRTPAGGDAEGSFTGREILDVIAASADVGIVTVAPEIAGGLDLVRRLVAAGRRVSLGHSGATYEEAIAAIEAGASHATHLFNRMPPLQHRAPGLAGAVLARDDVAAELICDGHHVHPAMCHTAIAAKGVDGVMAITDGTAGSGLPVGSKAKLGGRTITVGPHAAHLEDGTLAGSTLTMDGAFRTIVSRIGLSVVDAARLCATTPARCLGLTGFGVLKEGCVADVVVLDRDLHVVRTFVGGREIYVRST